MGSFSSHGPAASSSPLVIIPCGGVKLTGRHRAAELYTGGYFKACLRYALSVSEQADVRILSARYGIITLDDEIDSYDLRLGQPGAASTALLTAQAHAQGIAAASNVIALGGKTYTAAARCVWPHAVNPIEGLPGIGYQLQALKALTAKRIGTIPERTEPVEADVRLEIVRNRHRR